MHKCEKCNREFKNNGAKSIHQKNCNGIGTKLNFKKEKRKEVCPKCGERILASKQKHYDACDGTGTKRSKPKKGYNSWNKGLTKDNSPLLKSMSDNLKERYKNKELIPSFKGRPLTEEHKNKLRVRENFGIVKRSKNEIYFAELCEQHFSKVLSNEQMFNGWDADVIIEDIKTAVLWNGKWHYEKIMKNHSVEQVQNRDKIKLKEIEKCGYKSYIIKDMGKYNKNFVEKEFKNFYNWAINLFATNK
jgi:predicted RNA-binding Zn-ribbon protein involved in translation (DUF1610 family)